MSELDIFLKSNNKNKTSLEDILSDYLIFICFKELYLNLEKDNNKLKFKNYILSCYSDISKRIIFENYINSKLKVSLTDYQTSRLIELILAYLIKNNYRIQNHNYNNHSNKQFTCSLCHNNFNLLYLRRDHIIPFKFVGDSLDKNNQDLCVLCNLKKGSSFEEILKSYFLS